MISSCSLGTPGLYNNYRQRHFPKKCSDATMPWSGKNTVHWQLGALFTLFFQPCLQPTANSTATYTVIPTSWPPRKNGHLNITGTATFLSPTKQPYISVYKNPY